MKKIFGPVESRTPELALHCRINISDDSKAVVLVIHGMMEHSARYTELEQKLKEADYGFAAIDLPGHGKSINSKIKHGDWLHNGLEKCSEEINTLISEIKKTYKIPVVLFGHSLGSFITLGTIERFGNNIDACILSGTNWKQSPLLITLGKMIASVIIKLKGSDHKSPFMHDMAFGGNNKRIEPLRTPYDWLSTDEKQVDKYNSDPMCGFHCSALLYKDLSTWLSKIYLDYQLSQIPENLPVFILSGEEDPVGNYGAGPALLADKIKELGVDGVKHKIYSNMRHECLNERERHLVLKDSIEFCDLLFGGTV